MKIRLNAGTQSTKETAGKHPIFNPLTALASTKEFKAEAAVHNTRVGICPKCGSPMSKASISNGDQVFWCATCRVASPIPNSN